MATFGYQGAGTYGNIGINGVIAGVRATPLTSGTLTAISAKLYCVWQSDVITVKCALYRDSDKTLVPNSETNERTWNNNIDENWYDFDYTGRPAPAIQAGVAYIIVVWATRTFAMPEWGVAIKADNDFTVLSCAVQTLAYGAFPAVLAGTDTTSIPCAYATYTEGTTIQHTLTLTQTVGGTISSPYLLYNEGAIATITAVTDSGYVFTNWLVDGIQPPNATTNPLSLVMDTDHEVQAIFSQGPPPVPGWFGNNTLPDTIDNSHMWQVSADTKLSCRFTTTEPLTVGMIVAYFQNAWGNSQPYIRAGIYDVNNQLICTTEAKFITDLNFAWRVFRIQDAVGNPLDVTLPAGTYWLSLQIGGYGAVNLSALFQYTFQGEVVNDIYSDGMDAVLDHTTPYTLWRDPNIFASAPAPFPPNANFSFANTSFGETTSFDATSTGSGYDGYNTTTITNYAWDFGDGTISSANSSPTITHNYGAIGDYPVTLTVTDSQGLTSTITKTVPITGAPPQPPTTLLPPAMSNVQLVYSTNFSTAQIDSANQTLTGIGEFSGQPGNYGNWMNAGSNLSFKLASYPDGQKAFGGIRYGPSPADRVSSVIFPRRAGNLIVNKEFLIERYVYFPAGYQMGSPTNMWFIFGALEDVYKYVPKFEILLLGSSGRQNGYCNREYYNQAACEAGGGIWYPPIQQGHTDLSLQDRNVNLVPTGIAHYTDWVLPTGRWFKVSWYQLLGDATTKGKLKIFIDNQLVLDAPDADPLGGGYNPDNPEWHFDYSLIKEYGDDDGTFPQECWISNVALYNVTTQAPVNLTVAISGIGTTDPVPGIYPFAQTSYTFRATPSNGYYLVRWDLGGTDLGNSTTLVLPITADMDGKTLTAIFDPIQQTEWILNISTSEGGTTNVTGSVSVPEGQSLLVTATPAPNNQFKKWTLDGTDQLDTNPFITVPAQETGTSHTLLATFEPTPILAGLWWLTIPIALGVGYLAIKDNNKKKR